MIFNGNFFIYRPIRVKLSGIFALPRPGPKVKKNSGEGAPLWGEFNGEVENLTPNFSPPNYLRAAVRGGLGAGPRPLTNFGSPDTWAFKFGRRKLFFEKIFFGRKLQGKTGQKFSGKTGRRSYAVPISIG